MLLTTIIYYISFLSFPFLIGVLWYWKKNKKHPWICLFFVLLSMLFIYACFIERYIIVVKEARKPVYLTENQAPPYTEIKAVVFSDPHIGVYKSGTYLKRVVEKVNAQEPDIILIPGDLVYYLPKEKLETELKALKNLRSPAFVVLGNHDVGFPGKDLTEELLVVLEKLGLRVVENKTEEIQLSGKTLKITGLKDLWTGNTNFELLKELQEEEASIVLAHNPDTVHSFPKDVSVDLVVSGHTHGGQVRIPWLYKKAIPTVFSFDQGFYQIGNTELFVSSGVGEVALPLRLRIFPQIDVIRLFL